MSNVEWWRIFLLIFSINIASFIPYTGLYDSWGVFVPMPRDFKCKTEMNWFGCMVCYILLFILFPILNIGKLIYWLFHI